MDWLVVLRHLSAASMKSLTTAFEGISEVFRISSIQVSWHSMQWHLWGLQWDCRPALMAVITVGFLDPDTEFASLWAAYQQ